MIRIALVGDIGSGKSYIAKLFGYPVFNADNEVANVYKKDRNCFTKLRNKIPGNFSSFPIKKKELIKCILKNKKNLKIIIKIIHPIIRKKLKKFVQKNKQKKFVILDIQLYLENNLNDKKDVIIFVQSKKNNILKRLIKRKGYNKSLINIFRKLQLPLEKKKKKSNIIIKNDFKNKTAEKNVNNILHRILK